MKSAIKAALRPAYRLAKRALDDRPKSTVAPFEDDEFLRQMRYINPGMLTPGNTDLFAHCVNNLPSSASIVEIGSFAGLSLNHIIHFLRRSKRANPVFSVDAWPYQSSTMGEIMPGCHVSWDQYGALVSETFRRTVTTFSADRLPHHIKLSSDPFFAAWSARERHIDLFDRPVTLGGPISFAYIDGDHSYEQSRRDFENVDRHLEVGGFIVFDDSADDCEWDCKRTVQHVVALPNYELVAKNPNYCVRKVR